MVVEGDRLRVGGGAGLAVEKLPQGAVGFQGGVVPAHGDQELHEGTVGRLPQRLPYVEFWVAPGTSDGIGRFYREVLQCPVESRPIDGDPAAWVTIGSHQTFRFRERPGGGTVPNTNHVAVYLTRYRTVYAELQARGWLMEEDANEQFRFRRISDPRTGEELFAFEHEMRSLHHPDFLRPLANRVPVPYRVD